VPALWQGISSGSLERIVATARSIARSIGDADVHVREDSFACKETSELDRLLQRNQSGGFTSGVQLYEYLQSHNCIGLSAGRRQRTPSMNLHRQ
jgi:hypothetical protein